LIIFMTVFGVVMAGVPFVVLVAVVLVES
jgi:hypothetical protein